MHSEGYIFIAFNIPLRGGSLLHDLNAYGQAQKHGARRLIILNDTMSDDVKIYKKHYELCISRDISTNLGARNVLRHPGHRQGVQ